MLCMFSVALGTLTDVLLFQSRSQVRHGTCSLVVTGRPELRVLFIQRNVSEHDTSSSDCTPLPRPTVENCGNVLTRSFLSLSIDEHISKLPQALSSFSG